MLRSGKVSATLVPSSHFSIAVSKILETTDKAHVFFYLFFLRSIVFPPTGAYSFILS